MSISYTASSEYIHLFWKRLAYHHKLAEFLVYFMFITGFLLWETISISWQLKKVMLLTHMLFGVSAFTFIISMFWSAHRKALLTSKKGFLRQTGILIEWVLATCTLTGFYLFFYGNTGNLLSLLTQDIHFYSSWILVATVARHSFSVSILNFQRRAPKKHR